MPKLRHGVVEKGHRRCLVVIFIMVVHCDKLGAGAGRWLHAAHDWYSWAGFSMSDGVVIDPMSVCNGCMLGIVKRFRGL